MTTTATALPATPAPPLKRRKSPARTVWLILLALLVLGALWRLTHQGNAAHPTVKVVKAAISNVKETVSETGVVDPWATVDVKSKASGTLLQLAVEEGDVVKAGQLIATIDKTDNLSAYQQAVATVNGDQAGLAQAQDNLRLQNTAIGPQISQSQEGVAAARAKLTEAQEAYQQQIASARADVANTTAGVTAAQAKLVQAQSTAGSQPNLTDAAIAQAQAGVNASESSLKENQEALVQLTSATQPQLQAQVQATIDQDKSNLQVAQNNLTRQQSLFTQGFVPQNTLETAQNQVVVAQAALKTAQANLDTLKSQQAAEASQAQARIANAQQTLAQSRAALHTAQVNSVQNSLTEQSVVSARATLNQARAALATSVANRDQVAEKEQEVVAALAALRQSSAGLAVTKANTILTSVRAGDVTAAKAKLVHDQLLAQDDLVNLQSTTVVAPQDGLVLTKYVSVGTIIQSGQGGFTGGTAIVQLGDVSKMYVDTSVDEADIAQVQVKQKVKITLDAYPDKPIHGFVRKIYPTASTTSNVTYVHVQVQIDPKDVSLKLRSQMNATCEFIVGHARKVLAVPSDAVKDGTHSSTVTVIKDPTQPLWDPSNQETRVVKVGLRGDDLTEIKSGLKAGETVVTQIIQPASDAAKAPSLTGGGPGGRH